MIKGNVIKRLKELSKFDFQKKFGRVGFSVIQTINERVEKGVDSSGANFKRYNKSYSDLKEKSKRNTKPDLQWTGDMLNSMKYKVTGDSVIVDFENRVHAKSKSKIEDIASGNEKTRPFFTVTDNELEKIVEKELFKPFERLLNGDII
jgi:hypothetical protein